MPIVLMPLIVGIWPRCFQFLGFAWVFDCLLTYSECRCQTVMMLIVLMDIIVGIWTRFF